MLNLKNDKKNLFRSSRIQSILNSTSHSHNFNNHEILEKQKIFVSTIPPRKKEEESDLDLESNEAK